MAIEKRLLVKSMITSFLITLLLMVMAYLPIWSIMTEIEKSTFPVYPLVISFIVIFCVLTAVFYFDIRKILERKSY